MAAFEYRQAEEVRDSFSRLMESRVFKTRGNDMSKSREFRSATSTTLSPAKKLLIAIKTWNHFLD